MADNKDKKVLNVPHLRFPEFRGEWEKIRLGDNCNILMCKRIMAVQTNTASGVPFYKIGTIGEKADAYISKELFDEYKKKYSFPRKGEVMITCAGTVGKCIIYNGEDSYYQDSNIVWIDNPDEIITNEFLYHLLRKVNWSKLNSTTIVRIYNDDLRNLKFDIPQHQEQKKITRLLSLIDKRIATQNKIIEKLESLIKGITDTLLCNFSWDKVYLRSFMEFYPTNSFSWEQLNYEKGIIRNLHYGLIHGISTKRVTTNNLPFISSNIVDSKFVCCQNGDIAFADASEDTTDIGKAVEFTDVDNTFVLCGLHTIHGRDIMGLTVTGFKGFMFNSSYFHKQVRRVAQGTKVFSISANYLSSCYVYIPDKSEQTKITGLLNAMEMKKSFSSKLLELYKIQKQYLLRQMFI